MRAAVAETDHRERVVEHGAHVVEGELGVVIQREVKQLVALVLEERVVDDGERRRSGGLRLGIERVLDAGLVGGAGAEPEEAQRHHVDAREELVRERRNGAAVAGHALRRLAEEPGLERRIAHRAHALGQGQVGDGLVAREAHERVKGRLESEEHADGARGHLHAHREASGRRRFDAGEEFIEFSGIDTAFDAGFEDFGGEESGGGGGVNRAAAGFLNHQVVI